MVQWLRLRTSTARGAGLIPGRGTKILRAAWCGQNKQINNKERQERDGQEKETRRKEGG